MSKTILLAGATGLVGSACLPLLLADERVGNVVALVRRPLKLQHTKLDHWVYSPKSTAASAILPMPKDPRLRWSYVSKVLRASEAVARNRPTQGSFSVVQLRLVRDLKLT